MTLTSVGAVLLIVVLFNVFMRCMRKHHTQQMQRYLARREKQEQANHDA